jgi:hypothetical protein
MKKALSLILVLVMVFGSLAVTAGANMMVVAREIEWDIDETFYTGDESFKFTINERGILTISVDSSGRSTISMFNSAGTRIQPVNFNMTSGSSGGGSFYPDLTFGKAIGTFEYDLIVGGTYYINFLTVNFPGNPCTISISFLSQSEMERNAPLTANDALLVLRASAGLIELTAEQRERYGISGTATAADALRILRISAGLE